VDWVCRCRGVALRGVAIQELGYLFDLVVGWYGGHVGSHRPSGYVVCGFCDVISLVGADGISGAKTEAAIAVVFSPILVPGMGTLYHGWW